jgi:hypothetical protein
MPKTPSERLEQLVRLLTEITGHPEPHSEVHKSPLSLKREVPSGVWLELKVA